MAGRSEKTMTESEGSKNGGRKKKRWSQKNKKKMEEEQRPRGRDPNLLI